MKIYLNAPKHRVVFGNLFQVINRSTILPALENCMVSIADGIITYTASDLETTLVYSEKTELEGTYSFCIDASQLLFFLRNAMEDIVVMNVVGNKITLSCGGFSVKLPKHSSDDFPVTAVVDFGSAVKLPYNTLSEKLSAALKFVSTDDLRPAMTGVYLHATYNRLRICATDAHSLYFDEICDMPKEFGKYILPPKSCRMYLNNFKSKDCEILLSDKITSFVSEDITMLCRNIDARYPDYNSVIGERYELDFYMKRKQFLAFLKISMGYTDKSTYELRMEVTKDSMKCTGGDLDFDMGIECSVPVYNPSTEFQKFMFGANIKFLKKIVEINKDEYIKITHSTIQTKSFYIDDKFLLMPLMININ